MHSITKNTCLSGSQRL